MKIGESTPDFSLPATDGKTYSLSSFKEAKALLVIFMCNHCPYVLPKINEMKRIARDYQDRGLAVIGINSNDDANYPEDSFAKMKSYAVLWRLPFPYLRDESQDIAKAYGAVCTPDPFLLKNENGVFQLVFHSRIDDTHGKEQVARHELHEAVAELLEKGTIARKEQPSMGCSIKWKF